MLAKKIPNRPCQQGKQASFRARIRYVCANNVTVNLSNLAGDWHDAAFQMDIAAQLNPRVKGPAYHFMVSCAETETPSDEELIDAGHRIIYELGADTHQYVLVVHFNTSGKHLHGVLNKVHPITGATLSLGHDYARLEKVCRQIEYEMGWPQDRGRFDCEIFDGEVHLIPKPAEHWEKKKADRKAGLRPDGRAIRGHEQRTGLPALRDAVSPHDWTDIRHDLDAATDWQDVHAALANHGLRYSLHRSGARITRMLEKWAMAASQLGTAYGLAQMQKRLGKYVPKLGSSKTTESKDPTLTSALAGRFTRPLQTIVAQAVEQKRRRRHHRTGLRRLSVQHATEKCQLQQMLSGNSNTVTHTLRAVMREQHRVQKNDWLRENPRPSPPQTDMKAALIKLIPSEMELRKYRHVIRKLMSNAEPPSKSDRYLDHTEMRQAWALSPLRNEQEHPEWSQHILASYPDDIRSDTDGNMLLARRSDHGSIVGFDGFNVEALKEINPTHETRGEGINLLGPRDAKNVVVVENIKSALSQAATSADTSTLIVAVGMPLTPKTEYLLKDVVQDRDCEIAIKYQQDNAESQTRLNRLLPHASYRTLSKDAPRDGNHETYLPTPDTP
ncbi:MULTISPECIES: relaxase/mobilization nuclease domain-containing protein [Pacificibacter]|uniref:relaxase/mobilization nuclease domain-containing protein n=1 Tax=Pacificibacter TaxID=1042323 RepID=UPI001C095F88|nr:MULTISPECIES: relaxase/mobilization nuclease domain-containing protein [Pacificibacter]MBU2935175.1 relaxase/mobilization nuclease domain-containing protein [Pacificibacter marinus]MDO6615967.1 relaxase/mobilization nuclease domain-containing protein [Pacificibacter sp. 1_MG-2023]